MFPGIGRLADIWILRCRPPVHFFGALVTAVSRRRKPRNTRTTRKDLATTEHKDRKEIIPVFLVFFCGWIESAFHPCFICGQKLIFCLICAHELPHFGQDGMEGF
jgi:hypothetical protein